MKTKASRLLALVMAMAMVFAFCACNSEDSGSGSGSSGDADKVAAYVEKSAAEAEQSLENDMMEIELDSKGTAVVYRYTYKDPQYTGDIMKDALENALASASESFDASLELMKSEEPAVSSIIVEYYDASGELIISKTFR